MTKIYYVSIFFFHFHALYSLWEKFFFSLTHNSHRFYASFYLFSYLIKRKTLIFLCSFCYDDINVSSSVFFFEWAYGPFSVEHFYYNFLTFFSLFLVFFQVLRFHHPREIRWKRQKDTKSSLKLLRIVWWSNKLKGKSVIRWTN